MEKEYMEELKINAYYAHTKRQPIKVFKHHLEFRQVARSFLPELRSLALNFAKTNRSINGELFFESISPEIQNLSIKKGRFWFFYKDVLVQERDVFFLCSVEKVVMTKEKQADFLKRRPPCLNCVRSEIKDRPSCIGAIIKIVWKSYKRKR